MMIALQVDPDAFFRLLLSFGSNLSDGLNILEMVDGDKPLTPLVSTHTDSSLTIIHRSTARQLQTLKRMIIQ